MIPLYLIIYKVNRYFEEIIENKCLTLIKTNESKEKKKQMKNRALKSKI